MIKLYMDHHLQPLISIKLVMIITFNLLLILANTVQSKPHMVHHECTRDTNNSYASGSLFESNLNATLLRRLSAEAALSGFSKNTTGGGSQDQAFSVFYCHGHITGQDCRDCFKAAGRAVLQRCHLLKEGIVWYQECTLHYSNKKNVVFSTKEVSLSLRHLSYNFSSSLKRNLDGEEETFEELMNGLIEKVSTDHNDSDNDNNDEQTIQGYATGETSLSQKMTLGGVVQCRPDLVSGACQTCLRSALKQMDKWSINMVFLPSCNLKFYLFPLHYDGSSSTSLGRGGEWNPRKVLIPVAVVLSVMLFCIIVCLVILYRRKQRQSKPPPTDEAPHAASGEPPFVENHNPMDSPSIHGHAFDNYGSMTSTESYTTSETQYYWTAQNFTPSPEPSAPPFPGGHVNNQSH